MLPTVYCERMMSNFIDATLNWCDSKHRAFWYNLYEYLRVNEGTNLKDLINDYDKMSAIKEYIKKITWYIEGQVSAIKSIGELR